ncbi:sulfatase-like hydrolase/transferase [Nocardioides sp. P5_C9_2]
MLTTLAAVLVVLALAVPNRLEAMVPEAFVRLPVELLAYLALVLVLPSRLGLVRRALAVVAGLLLAVATVFKLLDVGFLQALNRPFDPLIDWRYAGSLVETVRGSAEGALGNGLLLLAGTVLVAVLVLVPWAVLRVTRVAVRHRAGTARLVAGLTGLWLALSLLDVRVGPGLVASEATAGYVAAQVARVPSQLRDQREFARAASADPMRDVPADDLLTELRGKDVLIVFVESYGRVAVEGSSFSAGVDRVLDSGTRQLRREGFTARSAFLTSPTFGAISWLAHSTLQSGLWVDSQQRYDHLVTTPRLTLTQLFGRAGWRTVADVPANNRDWPQGAFYGFDHVYDSRNVGYRGPRFGYPTMPDQYTLDAFHRLELSPRDRAPVMAEIDLITSHAPWSRVPRMLPQHAVGDGSAYDGMPETLDSETDIWPSPTRVRAAYGDSIEYSLASVVSFLSSYGDRDLVVVMLGDHQPATIVSGEDPGHDVPVSVIARDPAVTDRISGWGWDDGLRPATDAPVWRMDLFRDRFLAAYGPGGQTGSQTGDRTASAR